MSSTSKSKSKSKSKPKGRSTAKISDKLIAMLPNGLQLLKKIPHNQWGKILDRPRDPTKECNPNTTSALSTYNIICIKNKCRENINLQKPNIITAQNWLNTHWIKYHSGEVYHAEVAEEVFDLKLYTNVST